LLLLCMSATAGSLIQQWLFPPEPFGSRSTACDGTGGERPPNIPTQCSFAGSCNRHAACARPAAQPGLQPTCPPLLHDPAGTSAVYHSASYAVPEYYFTCACCPGAINPVLLAHGVWLKGFQRRVFSAGLSAQSFQRRVSGHGTDSYQVSAAAVAKKALYAGLSSSHQ